MSTLHIRVKVQPGARKDELLGMHDSVLRLRVTAPPEQGKANAAAIELVARRLGIAKSRVSLVRGAASRNKVLAIEGVDARDAARLLGED